MASLMDKIRHALGFGAPPPHEPSVELRMVAERQRRLKLREQSLDIQAEVLAADRRDARSHR